MFPAPAAKIRMKSIGRGRECSAAGWKIPEKINGYATQGSRVLLDLRFGSPHGLMITVFSNGGILYRGDDDNILPVLLTQSAQPGQKFLIAARVVAGDDVECRVLS